jgi:hypothetical protein
VSRDLEKVEARGPQPQKKQQLLRSKEQLQLKLDSLQRRLDALIVK